jgi:hypothetical protein
MKGACMELKKVIIISIFLQSGAMVFAEDIEDYWGELMHTLPFKKSSKESDQKSSSKEPKETEKKSKQSNLQVCIPPSKKELKLDYKELYDNFEKYENLETAEDFIIEKDVLLKEALKEIAFFDRLENGEHTIIIKYGVATVACFLILCAPWIPVAPFTNISEDAKKIVSALGGSSCLVLLSGTGATAYEYMQKNRSQKTRHEAVRNWLMKLQ